jgi:CMP-N-acetylneuraminic acid synthetase
MKIVIPARAGSKGLPGKNRKLFRNTADIIPELFIENTYVYTDDPEIVKMATDYGFGIISRNEFDAHDHASTKFSMQTLLEVTGWEDDDIILLYLTYPERTFDEVIEAYRYFDNMGAESLLCKKELETSPFLMLKEEPGNKASQLFYHNLYRRQDYPKCFEISHYVCIFKTYAINNLNENMYNVDTIFMPIKDIIDVDTQKDLDKFNGSN